MASWISVQAPINIALIKYWGKEDEERMLACNDSISMTIDSPDLCSETLIKFHETCTEDSFELEGQPEVRLNGRIKRVIEKAREFAHLIDGVGSLPRQCMEIRSKNTVPTASGLASSASGIAALAYGLIKIFELEGRYSISELSCIARLGSGSACRSLLGGLVLWKGEEIENLGWWPGLNGYVLVLDDERKKVSSSEGMNRTVQTSPHFRHRVENLVPFRLKEMREAIQTQNFAKLAKLAMEDSNCMHACCLTAFPPISYLTAESMEIIAAVHDFNTKIGKIVLGYTFDAGPNAVIFGIDEDPAAFIAHLPREYKTIKWKLGHGPKVRDESLEPIAEC